MGYVLPWGQMSFAGAVVITSLFSAFDQVIPGLGTAITTWLWGGFAVGGATLNRFFSLHYLLPFMIAGVVGLHIWALHVPGNNNPTGVDVKSKEDMVPFHPYYTVKDGFAIAAFFILFAWFVFFAPEALGHVDNQNMPANPLVTPCAHRAGVVLPALLRHPTLHSAEAVGRAWPCSGRLACCSPVPWLDTSKVRSMRYRPTARIFFVLFVLSAIGLGWCGGKETTDMVVTIGHDANGDPTGFPVLWLSRILAIYYYAWFLLVLPLLGLFETPLEPFPTTISTPVLPKGGAALPAGADRRSLRRTVDVDAAQKRPHSAPRPRRSALRALGLGLLAAGRRRLASAIDATSQAPLKEVPGGFSFESAARQVRPGVVCSAATKSMRRSAQAATR